MNFIKEFQEFINRGNVVDIAVGVVVGVPFTAIVNSLVADIFTPILGILIGGMNFEGLAITVGESAITYGNFIQAIINFLIIAFAVFMLVRSINALQARTEEEKPEPAPAPPPEDVVLLTEIRDLLKSGQSS